MRPVICVLGVLFLFFLPSASAPEQDSGGSSAAEEKRENASVNLIVVWEKDKWEIVEDIQRLDGTGFAYITVKNPNGQLFVHFVSPPFYSKVGDRVPVGRLVYRAVSEKGASFRPLFGFAVDSRSKQARWDSFPSFASIENFPRLR